MKLTPALVVVALAFAGCGGSSGPSSAPKTEQGLRNAYTDFVRLAAGGKAQEACDKYATAAVIASTKAFGGCAKVLGEGAAEVSVSEVKTMPVTITGNKATYKIAGSGEGNAVFVDGGWKIDLDSDTPSGADPGAAADEVLTTPDKAVEDANRAADKASQDFKCDRAIYDEIQCQLLETQARRKALGLNP